MLRIGKNDHEIIQKCRWGYVGAVSSAAGPWPSSGGGSVGKAPERCLSFLRMEGQIDRENLAI